MKKRGHHPVSPTEGTQRGQWIQFESLMAYTIIQGAVAFLDTGENFPVTKNRDQVRLFLHGTAEHLVGLGGVQNTTVEDLSEQASESIVDNYQSKIPADVWASPVNLFVEILEHEAKEQDRAKGARRDHEERQFPMEITGNNLAEIVPAIEHLLRLPHTASWMSGFAEVTAVVPAVGGGTIIFASPLYVERSPASKDPRQDK